VIYDLAEEIHGRSGDVRVQIPPFAGMEDYFVKAGEEKGFPKSDLNGYFNEGLNLEHK